MTVTDEQIKAGIIKALSSWSCRYEAETGEIFIGNRVADVLKTMREQGWKNVSRIDGYDFEKLGFRVVKARYVGGVRTKAFAREVVYFKPVQD